ncbi:hypothetical protein [Acrocarpospora phusangensis]|nr:hypothetical protein [Acrocarpospora phusangensis]
MVGALLACSVAIALSDWAGPAVRVVFWAMAAILAGRLVMLLLGRSPQGSAPRKWQPILTPGILAVGTTALAISTWESIGARIAYSLLTTIFVVAFVAAVVMYRRSKAE